MPRFLTLLFFCSLGASPLRADTYSYIHLELFAPSNAQLTEGLLASDPNGSSGSPTEPSNPTTLFGSLDRNFYQGLTGFEGYLPSSSTGTLILVAAKDGTFATYSNMSVADDGVVFADSVVILINSRSRISYFVNSDSYYYGNQLINFPRDPGFQITFQYGGSFTYLAPDHFQILSANGIRSDFTILSIPEPATLGLLLVPVSCLLLRRWPKRRPDARCRWSPMGSVNDS